MRSRKTVSMRLEAFDAEELGADGLLQVRNDAVGGRTVLIVCRTTSRPRIRFSVQQPSASLAPFDGAEPGAPEEGVGKGDGSHRLVPVGQVGILRIPL